MIEFGTANGLVLDFGDEKKVTTAKCTKKLRTFPVAKLAIRGYKTIIMGDEGFKIVATRTRVLAKLQNITGTEYIQQVIHECEGEDCELIAQAPKAYWAVERVSDSSFMIRRA